MAEGTFGFNQQQVSAVREDLQDLCTQFRSIVAFMEEISNGTTDKWVADAQVVFRSQLGRIEQDSEALERCTAAINNWLDTTEASYVRADQASMEGASNLI